MPTVVVVGLATEVGLVKVGLFVKCNPTRPRPPVFIPVPPLVFTVVKNLAVLVAPTGAVFGVVLKQVVVVFVVNVHVLVKT